MHPPHPPPSSPTTVNIANQLWLFVAEPWCSLQRPLNMEIQKVNDKQAWKLRPLCNASPVRAAYVYIRLHLVFSNRDNVFGRLPQCYLPLDNPFCSFSFFCLFTFKANLWNLLSQGHLRRVNFSNKKAHRTGKKQDAMAYGKFQAGGPAVEGELFLLEKRGSVQGCSPGWRYYEK